MADGTSKFFSSVIAKKNGLFSDISKQIETTFSSKDTNPATDRPLRRSSTSKEDCTPPGTPPPRPPPPRKPPNIQELREKEKIIKRMSSMPAYTRSDSTGSPGSSGRPVDRQLSMNGMNISFDEPLYSRNAAGSTEGVDVAGKAAAELVADASEFFPDAQFKSDIDESTAKMMEAMNLADPSRSKARPEPEAQSQGAESPATSDAGSVRSDTARPRTDKVGAVGDAVGIPQTADAPTRPEGGHARAPMFTTTKRRSSTVDEMLFDDYVEPEEGPVDTVFSSENLPQDLISFDQEAAAAAAAADAASKVSPHPSQSSVDSNGEAGGGHPNQLYTSTSVESSDVEYGGVSVHRSASMGSDKSWSSTYSLDSQPDEVTLECMEFMKKFVEKVFTVQ